MKGGSTIMQYFFRLCRIICIAAFFVFFSRTENLYAQYDKDVFYARGRQTLAEGKYAAAIKNFNVLTHLDTSDFASFFFRGIAKYNLGDVRGAWNDFDKSVQLNPVYTNGYHYRAIAYSRFGDYNNALKDLQKAIDLRPGFIGIYFSRGVTYFLSQQFDKAVKDFDKYIRQIDDDPSAYLNRGASYLFLKDTLKAVNDYNKAIDLDNYEPEGYVRRGRLYASMGDYSKAIADMDKAISLDTTNTYAYFNRAIMYYEKKNYNAAMHDLNRVLRDEPGNALTLYNRSLIYAQVGNYMDALLDMDRVININPKNVLAYFNRASYFINMDRWQDALDDYNKAIELYPDFAKAYMNRSYVNGKLGNAKESKNDYKIAQKKVAEYRDKNQKGVASFADTTKKYSSLLTLDAEFAKKDFDNELLQYRDIDIRLKPLYRFDLTSKRDTTTYALKHRYENPLVDKFILEFPVPIEVTSADSTIFDNIFTGGTSVNIAGSDINVLIEDLEKNKTASEAQLYFIKGLRDVGLKQFNSALEYFDRAVQASEKDKYHNLYKAFYYMNRGVLRANMIDFIMSIENNVQTLSMDDKGTTRARVRDRVDKTYDYSEAIEDMEKAISIVPDIAYIYFNVGNLYCLSSRLVEAIDAYDKAIELYPYMGQAYYNRGLILIYLKDKEKGCIDLSRSGELGVADAYSVISKYCEK